MKNIYFTLSLLLAISLANAQNKETKTADKLFNRYEYVEAAKEYLKVAEKSKDDFYVYKQLGDCYYNIFNANDAEKWYAKAIQKEQDAETYFRYAQMLKANKKYDASYEQMQKFSSLAPTDTRAKNIEEDKNKLDQILKQSKSFELIPSDFNSQYSDFGAYLNQGKVYFATARNTERKNYEWNDQPYLDIYYVDYTDGKTNAIAFPVEDLNSKRHDGPVTISPDGNTIYLTRDGFSNKQFVKSEDKKTKFGHNFILKATKNNGKWENFTSVSFNNKEYNTSSPSLSKDGNTLYFSSDMPGGFGNIDIWKVSVNSDGTFGIPINLGEKVNTQGNEQFCFIADNNTLYFSSNGKTGFGGLDVFSINLEDNSDAINLGKPVNSEKDDFGFTFNQSQNVAFLSSNRDGGKGDDDIYIATPVCIVELELMVYNNKTGNTVPDAKISIIDNKNNVVATGNTNFNGTGEFKLDCDQNYTINIQGEGYDNTILESGQMKDGLVRLKAELNPTPPIITKTEVILSDIYFDFDKSNITQQGATELDKLVVVMNEDPKMIIIVKSHTDTKGTDKYNMLLSEKRANATVQYIISKGIAPERLTAEGFGESKPKVDCGDNCTEEQHAMNRRSEFIIKKE